MDKRTLLQSITFGESIAEQETEKLKNYFLQTEYWNRVRDDSVDIIYGAKGVGKSAIYTNLTNNEDSLFDDSIVTVLAENPSGTTAFSNLKNDPPTTQTEFLRLWKLYFLVITANVLDEYKIQDEYFTQVKDILRDCNLIPAQNKLSSFLKMCVDFAKSFANGKEISTTAEFDTFGNFTGQKFSISFGEPNKSDFDKGLKPIEHVYDLLSKSLDMNNINLWILIDRLDVAFIESPELETNALRALFKTYLDLAQHTRIKLKIFLRDDIWDSITDEGFREASHITKYEHISWTRDSLLNLIIKRLLDNESIVTEYNLDKEKILSSIQDQEDVFYKFFPKQIDVGTNKPNTIDWILSRTRDGKGINTPREIIQLMNAAKFTEIKRLESGVNELTNDIIISRQAFKDSAVIVSNQRLKQTIYSEFPHLKVHIESLRGDKAEHSVETLCQKWGKVEHESLEIIKKLCDIGFFEEKKISQKSRYKIPFLYRPALEIIQGKAIIDE